LKGPNGLVEGVRSPEEHVEGFPYLQIPTLVQEKGMDVVAMAVEGIILYTE